MMMTAASVNMHYHGTNTPPMCHQDEVIKTLINAGETFTYDLHFPFDEPPGLYWYHPHIHGISEAAVQGGASGAIIVEGLRREPGGCGAAGADGDRARQQWFRDRRRWAMFRRGMSR